MKLGLIFLIYSKRGSSMRYQYEKPTVYKQIHGTAYACNHPIYNTCTLFKINNKGLAVVQQRYCQKTKATYWNRIDPWLVDELYLHKNFEWNLSNGDRKANHVGA